MRYKVVVAYNGSAYFGWQRQVDVVSVQEVLEATISTIFNTPIKIYGAGRTDAKVHAFGQVFHFDAERVDAKKLKYSLNRMLNEDILIKSITKVSDDFDARHSAKAKVYTYVISNEAKNPFLINEVLFYPLLLNVSDLVLNCKPFIGRHNFMNFTSKSEDQAGFVREIVSIDVKKVGKRITITFIGEGFMRGQIRFMVGALLALNERREPPDFILKNLDVQERKIITYKASGAGLYLKKVIY